MAIPADIPARFEGPQAWTHADMAANPHAWLYTLTSADLADLEAAARHYLSLGRDIGEIEAQSFPLRVFHHHLHALRDKLVRGMGVEVLRGLPVRSYSSETTAAIFCGIGAHLGAARSQNAQGHILGHVRDTGADVQDPKTRVYQTNARQHFHTDSTDVVGLLCLQPARSGGESLLVSAISIYNRMRAEHPELLALLFEPVSTDRRGEIPPGRKPWFDIPVFNWHARHLTVLYHRQYIESAQRFPDAIRLTPAHTEALDCFDRLANDDSLCFGMNLEAGDMQFVYNHTQLHDRTAFTDWPDTERRRHLLRLWLSIPQDRELPEVFAQRYGSIVPGDRGGIITEHTRLHAPLV